MCQFSWQSTGVQLVEFYELNQIHKFGVPAVERVEPLRVGLDLVDLAVFDLVVVGHRQYMGADLGITLAEKECAAKEENKNY